MKKVILFYLFVAIYTQIYAQTAVDLGLSVKWASCNVGASAPEESGEYVYWGHLPGQKAEFGLPNKKKICGDPDFDIATAVMGKDWSTPTKAQFEELLEKCIWEESEIKGISGYKVTGPNGNSIFIPQAGTSERRSNGNEICYKNQLAIYHIGDCSTYNNYNGEKRYSINTFFNKQIVSEVSSNFTAPCTVTRAVTKSNKVRTAKFVTIKAPGADIYVDDNLEGNSEVVLELPEGVYQIEARMNGYKSDYKQVDFDGKNNLAIELNPTEAFGTLCIDDSLSDVLVKLDGEDYGINPVIVDPIAIGTHTLLLQKDGYVTKEDIITICENDTLFLTSILEKKEFSKCTKGVDETLTYDINGFELKMMPVQGSTFERGKSLAETIWDNPQNKWNGNRYVAEDYIRPILTKVKLSDYYISQTEVSIALYNEFIKETHYEPTCQKEKGEAAWLCVNDRPTTDTEYAKFPVSNVSWFDCVAFCDWLSDKTGVKFSLPTTSQWEFAANGGVRRLGFTQYGSLWKLNASLPDEPNASKDDMDVKIVAKVADLNKKDTSPIASFDCNEIGLFDMSGNLHEWCLDWYDPKNSDENSNDEVLNPQGPETGSQRTIKGGGPFFWSKQNYDINAHDPDRYRDCLGFRVVCDATHPIAYDKIPEYIKVKESPKGGDIDEFINKYQKILTKWRRKINDGSLKSNSSEEFKKDLESMTSELIKIDKSGINDDQRIQLASLSGQIKYIANKLNENPSK